MPACQHAHTCVRVYVCTCIRQHACTHMCCEPAKVPTDERVSTGDCCLSLLGLAKTIYIRCIHGIFGREITTYTVIHGVYVRFWPTLVITNLLWCAICREGEETYTHSRAHTLKSTGIKSNHAHLQAAKTARKYARPDAQGAPPTARARVMLLEIRPSRKCASIP